MSTQCLRELSLVWMICCSSKSNFEILTGQLPLGSTFWSACRSIARPKSSLGALTFVGRIFERKVGWSAQASAALYPKSIERPLQSVDYIGLRVRRFTTKLKKYFLATPVRARHTGSNMFNKSVNPFHTTVKDQRKNKVIGIESDGMASIVGSVFQAIIRLERIVLRCVYRVWCGANHLDLARKSAYNWIAKTFSPPC